MVFPTHLHRQATPQTPRRSRSSSRKRRSGQRASGGTEGTVGGMGSDGLKQGSVWPIGVRNPTDLTSSRTSQFHGIKDVDLTLGWNTICWWCFDGVLNPSDGDITGPCERIHNRNSWCAHSAVHPNYGFVKWSISWISHILMVYDREPWSSDLQLVMKTFNLTDWF